MNLNVSKLVITVAASCITGALGWVAMSIQEMKVEVAVLAEKVGQLEKRIDYAFVPAEPEKPSQDPTRKYSALPVSLTEPRYQRK